MYLYFLGTKRTPLQHPPEEPPSLNRILYLLEDIKQTQRVHGGLLQSLLRKGSVVPDDVELPEDAQFPISTLDEFHHMERCLRDTNFQQRVVSYCFVLKELENNSISV